MTQLLAQFQSFLEAPNPNNRYHPLSSVSIKNYLSDTRRYLLWLSATTYSSPPKLGGDTHSRVITRRSAEGVLAQVSSTSVSSYLQSLQDQKIPTSTITRHLSSLRRFCTFLEITYHLPPVIIPSPNTQPKDPASIILRRFRRRLTNQHKSLATIKNYLSDLRQFLKWASTQGITVEQLTSFQFSKQVTLYLDQLKGFLNPSTLSRRASVLKYFQANFLGAPSSPNPPPINLKSYLLNPVLILPFLTILLFVVLFSFFWSTLTHRQTATPTTLPANAFQSYFSTTTP